MKRKLLIFGGIITVIMGVVWGGNAYAAARTNGGGANGCDVHILGFNAWWNGLGEYMDGECSLKNDETNPIGNNLPSFVWTIALNILHDLFAAIGYISVALIIFGGYMYITSGGDPGKSVKARKTLTSAVVGLIIVLLANVIVDTIVETINFSSTTCGGTFVKLPNCVNNPDDTNKLFVNIFDKALTAGAIMAIGFIVYGGISYITANGSPDKARKALRTLIFAAVGLVVVVAATIITNFILSSVDNAVSSTIITIGRI